MCEFTSGHLGRPAKIRGHPTNGERGTSQKHEHAARRARTAIPPRSVLAPGLYMCGPTARGRRRNVVGPLPARIGSHMVMWGWSWSLVVLVRSLFCFCFRCRRTCLCRRRRCSSVIARTHPPCIRISGCLVSSRATLKQSHTPPDVVSTCRDALYWYPCSQYVRPPFPLPSPPQGANGPRGVSSTRWPT